MSKRKVAQNIGSLGFIQLFNYVLPLIALPYLVKVLGIEKFGLFTFFQTTYIYANGVVDYGFKLTGTNEVSRHVEDKAKLSEVFYQIIATKLSLLIVTFVLCAISGLFVAQIQGNYLLFFLGFFAFLLGNLLFPDWFFQGVQDMKFIAVFNVISKSIFTLAIFFLVNTPQDYTVAVVLYALGFFISGIIAFVFALRKYKLMFTGVSLAAVREELTNGWHVFVSSFMVQFYSSTNLLVLGAVAGNVALGLYSIAYKVFTAVAGLGGVVSRGLYPQLSRLYYKDELAYRHWVQKSIRLILGLHIMMAAFVFATAPYVIDFLSESRDIMNEEQAVWLIRIFAIGLVTFPFGAFYSQILVIKGLKQLLFRSILLAALTNLLLLYPVIIFFGTTGLAFLTIIVYTLVGIFCAYGVRSRSATLKKI